MKKAPPEMMEPFFIDKQYETNLNNQIYFSIIIFQN